jgi:hypothetical protein
VRNYYTAVPLNQSLNSWSFLKSRDMRTIVPVDVAQRYTIAEAVSYLRISRINLQVNRKRHSQAVLTLMP